MRIPVCIKSMRDTKHLVQAAECGKKDVDLICGRYVVNAKSMLGVFSLPRFDQVDLNVDESDFEIIKEQLQKYNLIRK